MAIAKAIEKQELEQVLVAELKKITVYCTEKDRDELQVAIRQRPNAPESVNQLMGILARLYLVDKQVQAAVEIYVATEKAKAKGQSGKVSRTEKSAQRKGLKMQKRGSKP